MRRRDYLAACGVAFVAGCSSDDGGGATTPQPDTATPTEEQTTSLTANDHPTPPETETPTAAPASFVVESFTGPDSVSVGETHQLELVVSNTGGEADVYAPTMRFTTSRMSGWEESEVVFGTIEPGETRTFTSDQIAFDQAMDITYELADTDAGHTYEVTAPGAGLALGRSGLVEVDLGYETTPMAEVAATNTGDAIAGRASLTVDWLDDSGEYLASTTAYTRGLQPGETWLARADPGIDVEEPSQIADFEVSPGQASRASFDPDGVTVSNAQHRASEQDVVVRASVQNTRDSPLDYLVFVGKVYNDAGEVIGHYWTNETEVEAGATVRFEGNPGTRGRNGQVTDHEVLVSTESL